MWIYLVVEYKITRTYKIIDTKLTLKYKLQKDYERRHKVWLFRRQAEELNMRMHQGLEGLTYRKADP